MNITIINILILYYILKIVAISIYMYLENNIAKRIREDYKLIETTFNELIDLEYLKSTVENPNDEFKKPNSAQQKFTKILIKRLRMKDSYIDNKINKFLYDNDNDPEYIIKLCIQYSTDNDIVIELEKLTEEDSSKIIGKTEELKTKYTALTRFIKENQKYPINIIIDTFIITIIFVAFVIYILYHKLIITIIITLIVLIILITIYIENNSFTIIIIIFVLYACVYTIFWYKLYILFITKKENNV